MTPDIAGQPPPSTSPGPSNAHRFKGASFADVLEEIACRFIDNLPEEELRSVERVCFQVEQAHWYYEDFVREANPKLPSLPLKKFSQELFNACPILAHWSQDHELAFNQFVAYKIRVPVCGAIMLNDKLDKCVLVRGYKASSGWGYPKGKINQNEREVDCAVREVLEETGYNLADQIDENDYFTTVIREQSITLFVVPNVPESFEFKTRTRKEIGKIEWFRLQDLPSYRKKREAPGKFYLVVPFISQLKDFIARKKREARALSTTLPHKFSGVTLDTKPPTAKGERSSGEESPTGKGSSSLSSSTGNGGPTTPPPPDLVQTKGMDPHLANLLNGLSMSVNAVKLNVKVHDGLESVEEERPSDVTTKEVSEVASPPSDRTLPAPADRASLPFPTVFTEPPETLSAPLPVAKATALETPPGTQRSSSVPSQNAMNDTFRFPSKRAKHLALLDSVMEDLVSPTPGPSSFSSLPPAGPGPAPGVPPPSLQFNGAHPTMSNMDSSVDVNHLLDPRQNLARSSSALAYSSIHPTHMQPHTQPSHVHPHPHTNSMLPPPPHHHYSNSLNPSPFSPHGLPFLQPQHLNSMVGPQGPLNGLVPRPLTSQPIAQASQAIYTTPGPMPLLGAPNPNGNNMTLHPNSNVYRLPTLPPNPHQSHLLELLNPRGRTVSQPAMPPMHPLAHTTMLNGINGNNTGGSAPAIPHPPKLMPQIGLAQRQAAYTPSANSDISPLSISKEFTGTIPPGAGLAPGSLGRKSGAGNVHLLNILNNGPKAGSASAARP